MKPRHLLLAAALIGVALLAWWPVEEAGMDIVEPVRNAARSAQAMPDRQAGKPAAARPAFQAAASADLFPSQSFRPPPPPPKALPPPPPMAPPLPFAFVGMWTENGQDTVFLSQGDKVLTVGKGMHLDGGWRLDDLRPGSLLFTYEPLNQQIILRTAP